MNDATFDDLLRAAQEAMRAGNKPLARTLALSAREVNPADFRACLFLAASAVDATSALAYVALAEGIAPGDPAVTAAKKWALSLAESSEKPHPSTSATEHDRRAELRQRLSNVKRQPQAPSIPPQASKPEGQTTSCKTCGKEVSRNAQSCPHCGENLPALRISCAKCGSNEVRIGQKGFSLKSAGVGLILLGPIGLVGGLVGKKDLEFACSQCNHRWPYRQADK